MKYPSSGFHLKPSVGEIVDESNLTHITTPIQLLSSKLNKLDHIKDNEWLLG